MPIPNPKKEEKESDYMGRCMPAIKEEFTSQDQRIAVCLTTFRKGKEKKAKAVEIDICDTEAYQKTYNNKKRNELKDSDFLFPNDRSFPIVSPQDVRDAISNFGRMKKDMSYDSFIKKLYQKAKNKGPEFVAAIPESTKKEYNLT